MPIPLNKTIKNLEEYIDKEVNDLLQKNQKEIYESLMLGIPIYVYHDNRNVETLSKAKIRHYVKTFRKNFLGENTNANPTK